MQVIPDEIEFAEYLLTLANGTATFHPDVGGYDSDTKTVYGKIYR